MNKVKLGDMLTFQRGYDLTHSQMKNGKIPVVGSSEIIGWHNEAKVKAPVLLIGRSGTVGRPQYYETDVWAHNTTLFVSDFHDNNPKFCYYFLQNLNLENYANSSGVPTLNRNFIHPLFVNFPNLPTQTAIARVLSSLDDKIELNNKINRELENLAKTIYEYWFVQNAKESWERKTIGEIAEVIRGTMITEKNTKEGKVKVIAGGIGYSYCHSEYNREKNTITISGSGANAGFVNFWQERIFASDCTTVRGRTDLDTILIYQHLKRNQENIFRCAKGSAQPHVYPSDIKDIWFYEIPQKIKDKFSSVFLSINEQIAKLQLESTNLSQLRDFLLPLLMNGQVTVGKTQREPKTMLLNKSANNDTKYQIWKTQIGLAARGDINEQTLRNIYEAIDENDR